MSTSLKHPALGMLIFFGFALTAATYFTFAAVQGDFGLLRRMEIEAERRALDAELTALNAEIAQMQNLTHRLSDRYLDLDLLDERAREVLGLLRADEIVIR